MGTSVEKARVVVGGARSDRRSQGRRRLLATLGGAAVALAALGARSVSTAAEAGRGVGTAADVGRGVSTAADVGRGVATVKARQAAPDIFAVTCARGRHLAIVDADHGVFDQIEVGAAPHGLAVRPDGRAFVATAEGIAAIDLTQRRLLGTVPYSQDVGPVRYGEYRPGGMGIAVTADGTRVAVGVYLPGGPSVVEVVDAEQLTALGRIPVGVRPFQVVAAADGRHVSSIDHDSYTVSVVDLDAGTARQLPAMPLGRGAFDKPHYAARRRDGSLLLPYQGRVLQALDPQTGAESIRPLSARTHQHGIALTPDEQHALIVGTGPAGGVSGGPSLTILALADGTETIVALAKPHETIALCRDGRRALLTGGYLLTGGWDGLTVVDLDTHATREIAVPDGPLDIALVP